jgi:hypothetical protein
MDVRVLSASCADESILADGEIVRSRSPDAGIKPLAGRFAGGDGGQTARRTEEITYKP